MIRQTLKFIACLFFSTILGSCKLAAFYIASTNINECPPQVDDQWPIATALSKSEYQTKILPSGLVEIKKGSSEEYYSKLVKEEHNLTIQILGVDPVSQNCIFEKSCILSDDTKSRVAALMSLVESNLKCKPLQIEFIDLKRSSSVEEDLHRWKTEANFLIK